MVIFILSLVVLGILWRWVSSDIMLTREAQQRFGRCLLLTMLTVAAEAGCYLTDNAGPAMRGWSILFNVLGFAAAPFVFVVESGMYSRAWRHWEFAPALLNLSFVLSSPLTGAVFFVTSDGLYHRGPLFVVFLVSFCYSIFLSLYKKVQNLQHFPAHFKTRILTSSLLMVGALLVQVICPQYHTTWIIITVYFVLYYAFACEVGSMLDGLTSLLNKASFNKLMINFVPAEHPGYALLMIDVNNFKLVNDKYGHLYGDNCLIALAGILRQSFDASTQIFRFGGDEFCVLLNAGTEEDLQAQIARLQGALAAKKAESEGFPDVAVGSARFVADLPVRDTIDLADNDMYANKQKMRG